MYPRADDSGLGYGELQTTTGGASIFRTGSNSSPQNKWALQNTVYTTATTTYPDLYVSVLMNFTAGASGSFRLSQDSTTLMVGFDSAGHAQIGNVDALAGTALTNTFTSFSTYAAVTTHLLVAHFTNGSVDLWLDPTDLSSEGANTPLVENHSLTYNGTTDSRIGAVGLFAQTGNSLQSPTFRFDELRIGTTWADVTPVPEPAPTLLVLASLGLVGAGASLFRRRRPNR